MNLVEGRLLGPDKCQVLDLLEEEILPIQILVDQDQAPDQLILADILLLE